MRKVFLWAASGRGFLWFLLMWASLLFVEYTGFFRLNPPTAWQVLQSYPSRILAVCALLSALVLLIRTTRSGKVDGRLYRTGKMLYLVSIIILCATLWVSAYTHFEGNFIRSEGETFNAFPSEYLGETMFFSSKKGLPQVGMSFVKVRPMETDGRLGMVEADVLYSGRTTDRVLEGTLSSDGYFVSDWALAHIVDFGYAVRFSLLDLQERELESALLPLKTYPPGTEDKFEATFPGYQFYVQVFPDYIEQDGTSSSKSVSLNNPAIHLRITRNKDITFDDVLTSGEKLRFDNLVITFPSTAYWVKVRMVRDMGLPVAAGGVFFLCVGTVLMILGRRHYEAGE